MSNFVKRVPKISDLVQIGNVVRWHKRKGKVVEIREDQGFAYVMDREGTFPVYVEDFLQKSAKNLSR